MAASSRAPMAPRVASVSGSRLTTTSASGSSAGSSSVPWTPSRARRATPTTSQSKAPSIVASARPIEPKPRTSTRRFDASPSLTSSQCRRACCSAHLAGALGVGQDRGHHPFGHRAVARPARAAQRHAGGNAVDDPVDAGRQQPARRAAPASRPAPACPPSAARRTRRRAPASADDLDAGRRRAERRRGRRPRPSRRGQHARERRAQALEEVGDLAVVAVEVERALGGRDRVGDAVGARERVGVARPRGRRGRSPAAWPARSR